MVGSVPPVGGYTNIGHPLSRDQIIPLTTAPIVDPNPTIVKRYAPMMGDTRPMTPRDAMRLLTARSRLTDPIPIERAELQIPHLPSGLEGFTILHISDTHVSRGHAAGRDLHHALLHQLAVADTGLPEIDLAVLTGDYMSRDGDEPMATEALRDLVHTSGALARLGCVGVFGNHDHAELRVEARDRARSERWPIRWLHHRPLEIDGLPLELIGSDWPERYEPIAGLQPARLDRGAPLRLALAHSPDGTPDAHRAGAHLILAGHTHGGQIRIITPGGGVLAGFTSADLIPRKAPSGIYRYRTQDTAPAPARASTLCVTRGIGFQQLPLRLNCPPQIALHTLRRTIELDAGMRLDEPVGTQGMLEVVRVW